MTKSHSRQRAKRGSVQARLLIQLPAELDRLARGCATLEGVSVSEWWRRAALEAIRAAARRQGRSAAQSEEK